MLSIVPSENHLHDLILWIEQHFPHSAALSYHCGQMIISKAILKTFHYPQPLIHFSSLPRTLLLLVLNRDWAYPWSPSSRWSARASSTSSGRSWPKTADSGQ